MKNRTTLVPAALAMIVAISPARACAAGAAANLPLQAVAQIRLPGNPTRLDYQSIDPRKHLLFIAHLGDSRVIVVDTRRARVVATVPNVSRVHGVLVVPDRNTAYASATGTNEVVAIDETTFKVRARMSAGVYPDGIAYHPGTQRLFVSDEHGKTDTVIDTISDRRIGTIQLGGEVGNTQYDPASRHIFSNVQTTGQLVEIDAAKQRIVRRIPIAGCDGNHGLLIDARRRRAFIACEDNATLIRLDMRTMHVVASWKVGDDPDVLSLDDAAHRLYVAAESGVVAVFSDGSSVARLAQGFLAPAAHTVAVDPWTHLIYFPLQSIAGKPVLKVMKNNR